LSRVRVFSHRPSLLILPLLSVFFFNDTATTEIYTLSLHDALPISMNKKGILVSDLPGPAQALEAEASKALGENDLGKAYFAAARSEEHTSELQSLTNLVCRLLLEKKKKKNTMATTRAENNAITRAA